MTAIATELSYVYPDMFKEREGKIFIDNIIKKFEYNNVLALAGRRSIASIPRQSQLLCDRVSNIQEIFFYLNLIPLSIVNSDDVKLPSIPRPS